MYNSLISSARACLCAFRDCIVHISISIQCRGIRQLWNHREKFRVQFPADDSCEMLAGAMRKQWTGPSVKWSDAYVMPNGTNIRIHALLKVLEEY